MGKYLFLVLNLTACATAEKSPFTSEDPLLVYEGKDILVRDLPPHAQMKIYNIERERSEKFQEVVSQYVVDQSVDGDLKSKKNKDVKVEESELKAYYEKNRAMIPYPYESIKNELKSVYLSEKETEDKLKHVDQLLKKHQVQIYFTKPNPPKFEIDTKGLPALGNGQRHVVVQFLDYTCPHCQMIEKEVEQLLKDPKLNFKLISVDTPFHGKESEDYAKGAFCAERFGKYKIYREQMLNRGLKSSSEIFSSFPTTVGLGKSQWDQCLSSPEATQHLARNQLIGRKFGIDATPRFLVDGLYLESLEDVKVKLQSSSEAPR